MGPGEAALEAFRRAVACGLPLAARLLGPSLVVETRSGRGVLYVQLLEGGGVALSAEPGSPWNVVVAELGDPPRFYPERVPHAVAQREELMSPIEADVWRLRISLVGRLEPAGEPPPVLRPYLALGGRVMLLPETRDYAVVVGRAVVAWYNEVTGRLDDALPYQLAMGLGGGGEERRLHCQGLPELD